MLDKKEVNIDTLRENVRSYQDLERMLTDVKKRIEELEQINAKEAEIENYMRIDRHQEYYLARVELDLTQKSCDNAKDARRGAQLKQDELEKSRQSLVKAQQEYQGMITSLSVELENNEDYRALNELQRRQDDLNEMLSGDKKSYKELQAAALRALSYAGKLLEPGGADDCVREYAEYLEDLDGCETLSPLRQCLEKVISYKKEMYAKNQEELAEKNISLRDKRNEEKELKSRISQLEKKQLIYPPEVMTLAEQIRAQFRKSGRGGEVRVLCELLEVVNPAWQNAVEGYLNTQRFYLLVDPDDFDLALSVYDRMRENKKVYGVGLINTAGLEAYDEAPEGSLAQMVTSKSIWARRYVNMILGRVHCCKSYQELKQYPVSITRQCMRYQNHVVSAVSPKIYETPYIGGKAYLRQLEQCRSQEKELEDEILGIRQNIEALNSMAGPLDSEADIDVKYRLSALEEKREHESELQRCREQISKLKKNQTLILKTIHLDELRENLKTVQDRISDTDMRTGQWQQEEKRLEEEIASLQEQLSDKKTEIEKLSERLGPEAEECEREYDKQKEGRDLVQFKDNFERARKSYATQRENAEHEMVKQMDAYKIAHDFGAAASMEGYPEFFAEYDKLKNSQLLSYEEKVEKAREAAEEEFREQFLSRLQENIRQAQSEFKELNRALRDIHFSHEQYEFLYEPNRKLKKYYQMIMDDFNVMEGESIFSGVFQENHREVIEELFEKLTLDDEDSARVLEEYTDYRTYMDYDIRITTDDGGYMLYSKVSREKSGGETQTPFYITVAASFIQLYRNSIGGDSIGLVMFDEAFNNMDDERIGGMLEFLTHSNLQVIIAAPPDKIQYIGPSVSKVLLVMQDGNQAYVEDFSHAPL